MEEGRADAVWVVEDGVMSEDDVMSIQDRFAHRLAIHTHVAAIIPPLIGRAHDSLWGTPHHLYMCPRWECAECKGVQEAAGCSRPYTHQLYL